MTSAHCSGVMSATSREDADAGVVDEDVEAAEARHRRGDGMLDVRVARTSVASVSTPPGPALVDLRLRLERLAASGR